MDLIAVNGKVWTENPRMPEAEAFAVRDQRVVEIGRSEEILRLADSRTQVIDLHGKRVLPGLNDAHVHFFLGGQSLAAVQLMDAASQSEFRRRIAAFARTLPAGEWILMGNWDEEKWAPAELPTHELIDDVTPDHPVWVNRSDSHMMLANALAMKLAGIDRHTADVPGGEIVRDRSGNPTGIFKDAAKDLVQRVIPPPSDAQIDAALLAAQQHAFANGITSVQDMGPIGGYAADRQALILRGYQRLEAAGKLKVRVSARFPLEHYERLASLGIVAGFGSDRLTIGFLKSFGDGALGSRTAWFIDSYEDVPGAYGLPLELLDPERMLARMIAADRAGLHIATHAIGDRTNKEVLDLYERLEAANGAADRRLRIEHAQHLRPEDIPRFAQLGVIASVQPYHCIDDARWAERRIGRKRALTTYALRSLLDAGATLACGSDWTVAPMDPIGAIYAAVTRCPLGSEPHASWVPEQSITVAEAVHGYTVGSAYAESQENRKGSIEEGKVADFVVLSEDIFRIDPADLRHVKIEMTVSGGEIVYQR